MNTHKATEKLEKISVILIIDKEIIFPDMQRTPRNLEENGQQFRRKMGKGHKSK